VSSAPHPHGWHILIVEDQTMLRELLAFACSQVKGVRTVESAADGKSAVRQCQAHPPELALLDLVLPDGDGLALLPELYAAAPALRVIALSSHLDEFMLHRVAAARVHGVIHKNEQPLRILGEAIAAVMAGRIYHSPIVQTLRASLRADPEAFDKILSDREQETLGLVGGGLTNEQIAERLGVTVYTAKAHRMKLMRKLGLHSTPQLIRYALEKGFTRLP
jgi:DNA-binding NarL/FixJ family response regulator